MRRRNKIAWALALAFVVSAMTIWAIGCLDTSDEEFDDELNSSGDLQLVNLPNFQWPGDDDDYYYDDDDDYYYDDDDDDTGPYCQALIDCVCSTQYGEYYDSCVETVQALSEDYCQTYLEENLPECLPY